MMACTIALNPMTVLSCFNERNVWCFTIWPSHDVEYEANTTLSTGSLPGGWAVAPTNATMRALVAVSLTPLTTSDQSCTLAQPFSPKCKRLWQC